MSRVALVLAAASGCEGGTAGPRPGLADAGPPDAPACAEGDTRCASDGRLEMCMDGDWSHVEECPDGKLCDPARGACRCDPPGLLFCLDHAVVQCDETGHAEVVKMCEEGETCEGSYCIGLCDLAESYGLPFSCEFWAVDLDNDDAADALPFSVLLGNACDAATDAVVERRIDGEWTAVDAVMVPAYGAATFEFDDTHQETSGIAPGGAYRITTDLPVVAYQFNAATPESASSGGTALFDPRVYFSNFYALTLPGNGPGARSEVTVVATEDATNLFVRLAADVDDLGLLAGEDATFTLDAGDTLLLASDFGDLSGTYLEADQQVLAFGHHERARPFGDLPAEDHVEEILLPTGKWGTTIPVAAPSGASDDPPGRALWRFVSAYGGSVETPTGTLTLVAGDVAGFAREDGDPPGVIEGGDAIFAVQFHARGTGVAALAGVARESWNSCAGFALPEIPARALLGRAVGADVMLDGVVPAGDWTAAGGSMEILDAGALASGWHMLMGESEAKGESAVQVFVRGDAPSGGAYGLAAAWYEMRPGDVK